MFTDFTKGAFGVRKAASAVDLSKCLRFRSQAFAVADDGDPFDATYTHISVTEQTSGDIIGYFRANLCAAGDLDRCYSAQYYDLSALSSRLPVLEIGRFCIAEGPMAADAVRLAWVAITRLVDASQAKVLIGCTSLRGADAAQHAAAFGYLQNYAGSDFAVLPHIASVPVIGAPSAPANSIPAVLRTYLSMGAKLSNRAVIDQDLDTSHIFTAVEIAQIPAARAAALRAMAQADA